MRMIHYSDFALARPCWFVIGFHFVRVPRNFVMLLDSSPLKSMSVIWDFGACGCSGWGIECVNMVLPLREKLQNLGIIASRGMSLYKIPTSGRTGVILDLLTLPMLLTGCFCPGFADDDVESLVQMQTAPMNTWDVDVFVSHKPPSRFPVFPYYGAVTLTKQPR